MFCCPVLPSSRRLSSACASGEEDITSGANEVTIVEPAGPASPDRAAEQDLGAHVAMMSSEERKAVGGKPPLPPRASDYITAEAPLSVTRTPPTDDMTVAELELGRERSYASLCQTSTVCELQPPRQIHKPDGSIDFPGLRVVFVDDEPPNVRVGTRFLKNLGIQHGNITILQDGESLLIHCSSHCDPTGSGSSRPG